MSERKLAAKLWGLHQVPTFLGLDGRGFVAKRRGRSVAMRLSGVATIGTDIAVGRPASRRHTV
ncbi:MAG: hypothetical protein AAGF78_04650 [Pseudomonadota bacterium]